MKWDLVQGEFIKKLYSGAKVWYYMEGNHAGMIQMMNSYIIFRCPVFYCYVAFPDPCNLKDDLIYKAWHGKTAPTLLVPKCVELYQRKPVQVLVNAETGDDIKVNTTFYSKFVEKADQLTFWGTDYRSPVFAINGDSPDPENIVFMVLPIA